MRGGGGPFLLRARRSLGEHEQRSKSRMVLKETLSVEALLQNEVSLGKFKIKFFISFQSLEDETMCAQTS
jgi:hypothetical protein